MTLEEAEVCVVVAIKSTSVFSGTLEAQAQQRVSPPDDVTIDDVCLVWDLEAPPDSTHKLRLFLFHVWDPGVAQEVWSLSDSQGHSLSSSSSSSTSLSWKESNWKVNKGHALWSAKMLSHPYAAALMWSDG